MAKDMDARSKTRSPRRTVPAHSGESQSSPLRSQRMKAPSTPPSEAEAESISGTETAESLELELETQAGGSSDSALSSKLQIHGYLSQAYAEADFLDGAPAQS